LAVGSRRATTRRIPLDPFVQKAEMLASQTAKDADGLKREAAARALEYVRPGMRLGLGTGSTAAHFVDLLAEKVKAGLDVVGVPDLGSDAAPGRKTRRAACDTRRAAGTRFDGRRRR
jgi:DNA-binding transcriptional regulator LsrR (DeoR family)